VCPDDKTPLHRVRCPSMNLSCLGFPSALVQQPPSRFCVVSPGICSAIIASIASSMLAMLSVQRMMLSAISFLANFAASNSASVMMNPTASVMMNPTASVMMNPTDRPCAPQPAALHALPTGQALLYRDRHWRLTATLYTRIPPGIALP
jgi:hypothetical protein